MRNEKAIELSDKLCPIGQTNTCGYWAKQQKQIDQQAERIKQFEEEKKERERITIMNTPTLHQAIQQAIKQEYYGMLKIDQGFLEKLGKDAAKNDQQAEDNKSQAARIKQLGDKLLEAENWLIYGEEDNKSQAEEIERLKDVYEKAKKEIKELAMKAESTTEEGYARAEGIINWLDQALKGTEKKEAEK